MGKILMKEQFSQHKNLPVNRYTDILLALHKQNQLDGFTDKFRRRFIRRGDIQHAGAGEHVANASSSGGGVEAE